MKRDGKPQREAPVERDATRTRARILDAVGELLVEDGFDGVGVNAVARRAGVDKVLIYRYFGGMEGLLESFGEDHSSWLTTEVLLAGADQNASTPELLVTILRRHLQELRGRPVIQEIMRWELTERNALTEALARAREARGLELVRSLGFDPERWPEIDVAAVSAILYAGLTHVVLRAKTTDRYVGLDLTSEDGWERLSAAVGPLVNAVFDAADTRREGS